MAKKIKTVSLSFAVVTLMFSAATFSSCSKDNSLGNTSVTGISLDTLSLTLATGGEYTLMATVQPDNATDKTVTWTSSSDAIATVSAAGKVTAIAVGSATITAKAGDRTATCLVTVVNVLVDDEGLTEDIHNIIPDSILQEIEDLGMPIYGGNNPPANLEGTYLISPELLVATNIPNDYAIGYKFVDFYLTLSEQNNEKQTITVAVTEGDRTGSGQGAYFVGSDNKFSIFVPMDNISNGHNYNTVDIYSGIAATGGIQNYYYSTFMISGGGSQWELIENGQGRIFYDGDGFSEKTDDMRSSKIATQGMAISSHACSIKNKM